MYPGVGIVALVTHVNRFLSVKLQAPVAWGGNYGIISLVRISHLRLGIEHIEAGSW